MYYNRFIAVTSTVTLYLLYVNGILVLEKIIHYFKKNISMATDHSEY